MTLGHAIGFFLSAGRVDGGLLRRFDLELVQGGLTGWYLKLGARTVLGAWLVVTWILLALLFAPTRVSPFIYFQF